MINAMINAMKDDSGTLALDRLLTRHSVGPKHLGGPAPQEAELRTAFAAALRAPDHGKLIPFRFIVLHGQALERLADLFTAYGRRHGKSDADLVLERQRAVQAPLVIAVVARIRREHEVPAHEQWMAVGGAVSNLMNALHFMGYAAKMLSGVRVSDADITRAFCSEDEQLVGWISTGTPLTQGTARGPDPVDKIYTLL